MKKFITKYKYRILTFIFVLTIIVITGSFYFVQQKSNKTKAENYLQINDSFDVLKQEGFIIVIGDSAYSFDAKDIATNIVFDQKAFSLALNQAEALKKMIYHGSIIAVFDESEEFHNYEEMLGFAIGFMDKETSEEKTHKTIGYIYQADEFKHKEMKEQSEHFRKITMKVLTMQLNSITIMDLIAYGGTALGVIVATT